MNTKTIVSVLVIIVVLGAGYWLATHKVTPPMDTVNQMGSTNSGENAEPGGQVHGLPAEPAAVAARTDLAAKLGVSEGSIVIMKVEEKAWSDGCLGLGGAAESCLAALVDGFRVELEAQGKAYVYRTDKTGVSLRAETN
jgi:hypothetical protein